jgi:DNA-binding transcriptional LysR family regulator
VTVDLVEGGAASLEEMVANGTVDLAFRPLLPRMRESTLCHRTIWREDIVAVMRGHDPLAKQASVSIDDMLSRPLIGNPAGSEEDGGGFDLRNTLGEAAFRPGPTASAAAAGALSALRMAVIHMSLLLRTRFPCLNCLHSESVRRLPYIQEGYGMGLAPSANALGLRSPAQLPMPGGQQ